MMEGSVEKFNRAGAYPQQQPTRLSEAVAERQGAIKQQIKRLGFLLENMRRGAEQMDGELDRLLGTTPKQPTEKDGVRPACCEVDELGQTIQRLEECAGYFESLINRLRSV